MADSKDVDLVALQEVWGPATDTLQEQLTDFYIPPFYRGWSMPGSNWINTLRFYMGGNGGLSCAVRKKSAYVEKSWRHSFTKSNSKSKKGVHAHLVMMDQNHGFNADEQNSSIAPVKSPGRRRVLLVTCHLDPSNANRMIERQVVEVMDFIRRTVLDIGEDSSSYGIVLTGDFNAHSGGSKTNPWLDGLFDGTKCRDLYGEYVGRSWVSSSRIETYGGNDLGLYEPQSIDYIFAFDQIDDQKFAKIAIKEVEVLMQPKGEELSDHWGIKMKLTL